MRLKLETRAEPSRLMGYLSPLLAAGLTVIAGFILFSALGKNPLQAFYTFFIYPVRDLNGFAELLLKASPLMLIAVGLACGYRANVWGFDSGIRYRERGLRLRLLGSGAVTATMGATG